MDSEDFPRGKVPPSVAKSLKADGVVTAVHKKAKDKLENLFASSTDVPKSGKEKKLKRLKKLTPDEQRLISGKRHESSGQSTFQVVPLAYEGLVSDMLSLGTVHDIYDTSMLIVLPGRATGIVQAANISTPYTKIMKKHLKDLKNGRDIAPIHKLSDMFTVGQIVVVKVISTETKDDGTTDVKLSMNPADVHANYNASMITKDLTLVGAIQSKEDNGYVVDLGVTDVVAFLKYDEAKNKQDSLQIGQLIYCKVIQLKSGKGRTTVQVSMKTGKVKSQVRNEDGIVNYSALLPGMVLNTIVEKSHESGLKVSCFSLEGLVHGDHMKDEWTLPNTVEEASELHARVLYVHPTLTTPYLTLQTDLEPLGTILKREDRSRIGSLKTVRVVNVTNRGVIVKFVETGEKGLISLNHLSDGTLTSKEEISKKFKSKSEIQCSVLKYAHFERMYICSMKKDFLESKIINVQQASPGVQVKCKVTGVNKGGIEVVIGRKVKGFIPKSLVGPSNLWKQQEDAVGKSVNGKIMYVDVEKKRVIITLIRQLVKSQGVVITSLSEAKKGQVGHAIVTATSKGGVVLKTIGGVKGFIPVAKLRIPQEVDCRNHVKFGEIFHYQVLKVESDQLIMKPFEEDDDVQESQPVLKVEKKKRKRTESENTVESMESNASDGENKKPSKKKRRKNKKKSTEIDDLSDHEEDNPVIKNLKENGHVKENGKTTSSVTTPAAIKNEDMDLDDDSTETTNGIVKMEMNDLDVGEFWDVGKEEIKIKNHVEKNPQNKKLKQEDVKVKSSSNQDKIQDKNTQKESSKIDASLNKALLHFEANGPDEKNGAKEGWYWANFVSHYASDGRLDKARSVARQALDYGPIAQNSKEALKVWKELFTLELKFGTEDSVKDVLKEALQRTDNKYECYKMAAVTYEKKGRFEDAEKVYRTHITRECGDNVDGWINFARLYFENGRLEDARNIFHDASKQAQSRKLNEVNLTSRFAILEIYHGDIAKGSMLLDNLLQLNPQRVDIWIVYLQALIKKMELNKARSVFQRAFEINWKPQKVRSLLAQYKTFEDKHGNEETKKCFTTTAIKVLGAEGLNVLG